MEKDWMLILCHEVLASPLWRLRTRGLGAWSCLFGGWRSREPLLGAWSWFVRQPAVWAAWVGRGSARWLAKSRFWSLAALSQAAVVIDFAGAL